MQWANWISLGIIVTCFACMVQRLASSMRLTIYASAASCRHIMALPWKHRSVLPTWRAISQTSHEKGSFLTRSSELFLNHQISWRATVPGWYFLVFLTFLALRNSFWGALPPMVGQSFFLTSSSPEADGPASAAIWANCWVDNNDGDLPTSSSCLASSTHLSASSSLFSSSLMVEGFFAGDGWCTGEGGLLPSAAICSLTFFIQSTRLSWRSLLWHQFCPCHTIEKIKKETVVSWKHYYRSQTKIGNLHQIEKKCGITSFLWDFT